MPSFVCVCVHQPGRWFLQQLVLTMEYFHRRSIAHRDIKLENALLQVCSMHCEYMLQESKPG
jgi:hypothetical protein